MWYNSSSRILVFGFLTKTISLLFFPLNSEPRESTTTELPPFSHFPMFFRTIVLQLSQFTILLSPGDIYPLSPNDFHSPKSFKWSSPDNPIHRSHYRLRFQLWIYGLKPLTELLLIIFFLTPLSSFPGSTHSSSSDSTTQNKTYTTLFHGCPVSSLTQIIHQPIRPPSGPQLYICL